MEERTSSDNRIYKKKTFKVVLPETGSWDTVLVSLFVSVFVWNLHGCLSAFCVLVGNAVCACSYVDVNSLPTRTRTLTEERP